MVTETPDHGFKGQARIEACLEKWLQGAG